MEEKTKSKRKYEIPGVRYLFTVVGFLGFCVNYSIRVNLNVAIVAMVNNTAVYHHSINETEVHECSIARESLNHTSTVQESRREGEFAWSPQTQGVILGAFYYGYCILQVPGGRLAEAFSGKWVFGIGNLIPAILTLLTPLAARSSVGALIAIRALEGLAQGVSLPAMHTMIGRWLPDSEKGFLTSLIYCGIATGTVAGMNLAGIISNSDILGGWPAAFYIIGIFGCIWFCLWCLIVTDSPTTHPCISEAELEYITSNQKIEKRTQIPSTPWLKIMTSIPFWAVIVVQVGVDWCFYTLLSDLPTFFATVLNFELEKNAFLSSFPHVLYAVMALLTGYCADAVVRREMATINFIRKFCTSLACLVPAAGLIGVCLARCDVTLCVICLMISVGAIGCCFSGYMLSHIDLSPEYAGTLMGIANMSSALTGFLAPLTVGILTEESQSLRQWHTAFGITIIILIISNLVFLFFSSAQKQDWLTGDAKNSASEEMTLAALKRESL